MLNSRLLRSLLRWHNGRLSLLLMCFLAASCAPILPEPVTLMPSPAPTISPTATPIPSPTPTPTPTPIPPHVVDILWPSQVSALDPVTIEVDVQSPQGVEEQPRVSAILFDPGNSPVWLGDLLKGEGSRYYGAGPVEFELIPIEGEWRLQVYVQSVLQVDGELSYTFQPSPIEFRELSPTLPSAATILVPAIFEEELTLGDQVSGARIWRYGDGELSLWWAPGSAEPLLLNTAIVMLEATFISEMPPEVLDVEEGEWAGQPTFRFVENWSGSADDTSDAWVIQGPNYWLYVLRLRSVGPQGIPPLLFEVRDTFGFRSD